MKQSNQINYSTIADIINKWVGLFIACMFVIFGNTVFAEGMAPQSNMVQLKDNALHMMTVGEGEFTVIFESGFGNDLSHWRNVAPAISHKAKVVVYSRAGYGKSDPVKQARNLTETTGELAQLIEQAKLKPPYIFVGHSYGSHIVRTYAAQNPSSVAGLVLVDPAHEQFLLRLKQLDKTKTEAFLAAYENMLPKKLQAQSKILMAIDERGELPDFGPLPNVPAAVLTSMVQEHPQFIIHSPQGKKLWRALHTELFNQFDTARHLVTSSSGHNIAVQEPELVITAINTVINQASQLAAKYRLATSMNTAIQLINDAKSSNAEQVVFDALENSPLDPVGINRLGYQYLSTRNSKAKNEPLAAMILKYNMINNPQSANAYDSYGESLLALNKPLEAKQQFLQAIELIQQKDKKHRTLKGYKANLAAAEQAIKLIK